jgi:hypothetical protein
MWILPKQLHTSAFVQDTKALGLDSEEFSQTCEKSLSWRGKDSLSRTWLQRWKRENWIQHLSSRTLNNSHTESFVDKWTSYLADSRANPSVVQDSVKQLMTLDTCSHTSEMESGTADLELFSSKTLEESSQPRQGTENQFSNMSSENWKDWVTEQRQEYSQRKKSAHLIRESESSSLGWPTARTSDAEGGRIQTEMTSRASRARGTGATKPSGETAGCGGDSRGGKELGNASDLRLQQPSADSRETGTDQSGEERGVYEPQGASSLSQYGSQSQGSQELANPNNGGGNQDRQPTELRTGGLEQSPIHRWPARPGEAQQEWEEPRVTAVADTKSQQGSSPDNGGEPRASSQSQEVQPGGGHSGSLRESNGQAESELGRTSNGTTRGVDATTNRVDRLRLARQRGCQSDCRQGIRNFNPKSNQ